MNWNTDSEQDRQAYLYLDLWWRPAQDSASSSQLVYGLLLWSTLGEAVEGTHAPGVVCIMTEGS